MIKAWEPGDKTKTPFNTVQRWYRATEVEFEASALYDVWTWTGQRYTALAYNALTKTFYRPGDGGIQKSDVTHVALTPVQLETATSEITGREMVAPMIKQPDIDISLDAALYDIERIETDYAYGNFNAARLDDYLYENIVRDSLIAGQWAQASQQAKEAGVDVFAVAEDNGILIPIDAF